MASSSGAAPERRASQNITERDPDNGGAATPENTRPPPHRRERERGRYAASWSCPSLGTLAGSFLVFMSLYAGFGVILQRRVEYSTGLEEGGGAGNPHSLGWGRGGAGGEGQEELWWKKESADGKGSGAAPNSRSRVRRGTGPLNVARRVAAASWHLHSLVQERLEDSLSMVRRFLIPNS